MYVFHPDGHTDQVIPFPKPKSRDLGVKMTSPLLISSINLKYLQGYIN